jgi:hypothetical protein
MRKAEEEREEEKLKTQAAKAQSRYMSYGKMITFKLCSGAGYIHLQVKTVRKNHDLYCFLTF